MSAPRPIPLLVAFAVALVVGVAAYNVIPQQTEPVRTNIIGPETHMVAVETPTGLVDIEVELLAKAETHSIFAVENPYLEHTMTSLHLASALPAGLEHDAMNDAVTAAVLQRTAGSWKMDRIEIPRFLPGEMEAVATTRELNSWGLISNFGMLALLGIVAGAIVYGVIALSTRVIKRPRDAQLA